MTGSIRIAQISDLHIKAPGMLAYGKVDTAAALSRCIEMLNGFWPRLDLVVISGDLADTPTDQEYAYLNELLSQLEIPFAAVPGNHDDRTLMRIGLPNQNFSNTTDALNSVHPVGEIDVLLADSSVRSRPHGWLDEGTLAWLDSTVRASESRPALLFLHHPPFLTGIGHMDVQNLKNADALAAILHRNPRIRLIASGHVHRAVLTTFADRQASICPAPNHAVALDLDARIPPSFVIEPPAFHLHVWTPGAAFGDIVTHTVPIGRYCGPYPFFGTDGKLL